MVFAKIRLSDHMEDGREQNKYRTPSSKIKTWLPRLFSLLADSSFISPHYLGEVDKGTAESVGDDGCYLSFCLIA
jgi:hypothetical protein